MSAPSITRRALVAGAGALGTMMAPIAASAAPAPAINLDAALFDLIARHGEAVADMHRASAAFDDTAAAFLLAAPPQPNALLWRPGDFPRTSWGLGLSERDNDDAPRRYGARAAGWLRKHEPFPGWARRVGAALSEEEAEACEVRRREIVAAWDGYMAARHDVEVATGHAAAGEASDAAADLVVTLAAEIAASRPRTLSGLRALAMWFARQVEADQVLDGFLAQLAEAVAGFGGVAL